MRRFGAATVLATCVLTLTACGGGGGGTGSATVQGNAATGARVFASAGCSGCHTLAAANAHGNTGPNLDALKPGYDDVKRQVENGGGAMPSFRDTLTDQQIANVAAYVSQNAGKG